MHLDQSLFLPTNIMINHSLYNERLVNRGEILISKEAIGNWDNELVVVMNRGKEDVTSYSQIQLSEMYPD